MKAYPNVLPDESGRFRRGNDGGGGCILDSGLDTLSQPNSDIVIPAIVKPDGDQDPRDHITFHMEEPVGLTALGRKTIELLRLEEHESRRTHLREIEQASVH